MRVFDLHCDTLLELEKGADQASLAVSIDQMAGYERFIRLFAVFVPDELRGQHAWKHFEALYARFLYLTNGMLTAIDGSQDLERAKIGGVLSVESGAVLGGEIDRLAVLAKRGVKLMTLTWNGENELGYGQRCNRGLKSFGRACVREMERLNITVDVSHLSDRGFEDVCSETNRPFAASHSNARAVCDCRRNLTNEQISEIIRRGGLIGLNFYRNFLNPDGEKAGPEDILRHADHILSLGGQDVLCLGTDFDGAQVLTEFENDRRLAGLQTLFSSHGYSEKLIEKILFENAYYFFEKNWKEDEKNELHQHKR